MRLLLCVIILFSMIPTDALAAETNLTDEQIYAKRQELYNRMQSVTQIPWYYFAAVDQYERNVRRVRRDIPKAKGVIGIYYKPEVWAGPLNPNSEDSNPMSIQFFGGMGLDGNGDGVADSTNDEDVLFTFAHYLQPYGTDKENIKIALWEYYQRDKTVGLIMNHMKLYSKYNTLKLDTHAFPLPIRSNFSYRNTWGDARGWGGRRMHEGTDIFASYGVPVRSTCYGVIEIKGWNKFGGWRLGIRDINNTYHYFAHLNGFAKDLEVGQVVEPGQIIGSVGSSGYGPPGTAGKFPPHLHYGMYKDNGYSEWSFDPFPHLKSWERGDRRKR
ncbi:M23 family metallopeptidase [Sutcliffiella horikoshii]|uniref:M23 family metallopeptidase n=1 Tax=Sutcliffiella horikoshii TaxID=79883 RepID=UPI001CFC53E1